MSVRLEPQIIQPTIEQYEDHEDCPGWWYVSMANGTWSRLTNLLTEEERALKRNGCHDGQYYNPTQLELIAMRLEGKDREYFAADLIQLAREGGCIVQ